MNMSVRAPDPSDAAHASEPDRGTTVGQLLQWGGFMLGGLGVIPFWFGPVTTLGRLAATASCGLLVVASWRMANLWQRRSLDRVLAVSGALFAVITLAALFIASNEDGGETDQLRNELAQERAENDQLRSQQQSPASPPGSDITDAPTSPTTEAATTPSPSPAQPDGYTVVLSDKEVRLPPADGCTHTYADFDAPLVISRGATFDDDTIDLEYEDCSDNGLSAVHAYLGFGPDSRPAPADCASAARSRALGAPEPISSIKPGITLCMVTSEGAVAWIRVVQVGKPYALGNPTILTKVTLWRSPQTPG